MTACTSTAQLLVTAIVIAIAGNSADCEKTQQLLNQVKDFYVNDSSGLIATLESVQEYVASGNRGNFRVHVASGSFQLSGGQNATSLATFVNISNISIIGAGVSVTLIDGVGSAGFVFKDVRFVTITNLTFTNCSSHQYSTTRNGSQSGDLSFVQFSVSLYLVACSDLRMENVSINNSYSVGLAMFNVRGSNVFRDTSFCENIPPASDGAGSSLDTHGGGGAIVEFSFCRPGDQLCNVTSPAEVVDASFEFTKCSFIGNNVSSPRLHPLSIYPHGLDHSGFGKGGGLAVYFRGRAINNSIVLSNCQISGNTANSGGGLYVEFGDQSQRNTFTLTGKDSGISRIDNNGELCATPSFNQSGMEASGGGAMVVFMYYPPDPDLWPGYHANVTDNHVEFRDTYVSANLACNGGGVSFVSSRADLWTRQTNTVIFTNCTFQDNSAAVSAALDITVLRPDTPSRGELMVPHIHQCVFRQNKANSRSYNSIPNLAGYQFGNGALYIDTVPTSFSGVNRFTDNKGTGLVVMGADVVVTTNTSLLFEGNSGRRGGGLVVIGDGAVIAHPGAHLDFSLNRALELGGAIYSEGQFGERDTIYKEKCFIRYYQPTVLPSHWNARFSFSNNSAAGLQGNNTIYLTSLRTCVWPESGDPMTDVRRALCWPGWVYDGQNAEDINSCSTYVSTAPASFNNSYTHLVYQTKLYPGHNQPIPVRARDDYGNIVSHVVYQLSSSNSTLAEVSNKSVYVTNNEISVFGVPNTTQKQNLFLETLGPRILSTVLQVTVLPCPPGYTPQNYNSTNTAMVTKCKCGYSLYFTCNSSAMTSHIMPGYCVSYSSKDVSHTHDSLIRSESTHDPRMIVVNCPATVKKSNPIKLPVCDGTCDLEEQFCQGIHRKGKYCSGCMDGHAVDVNDIHDCVKCSDNEYRYGWFVYILTNIVPITIFFVVVALFKISATAAPMYAFVFFAQITTVRYFHNQFPWIFGLSERNYYLQPLLLSFYSIWNLDFFIFKDIICLSPDLTIMYSLLLKYLLALYPMLLILLSYICIELYDRNVRLIVWLWTPFRACLKRFRRSWQPRTSIIDAFAAFLMISYTRIAFFTITLLTPAQEYYVYHERRSKVPDGYVFYFDPQYRYFKGQHLPLGLLALVVGVVFVLAPPVFLFLYPTQVFQRCLNRWSRCSWQPVHTFADAFQGCFKNRSNNNRDYRYFSGLYLVLRIIILIVYAVEPLPFLQLLLQQIICILAVLLFALVKPYKEAFYNKVDLTFFSLLSIMNSLSFANFTNVCANDHKMSNVLFRINYALGFLPLLYITAYVIYLLLKWRGVIAMDPVVKELTVGKSSSSIVSDDSSAADIPDRLLHPEDYTISPPPSSCNSGSVASLQSTDAVSGEGGRERLVINRGRPKQRATEGSYFLKKAQYMKNYSSI